MRRNVPSENNFEIIFGPQITGVYIVHCIFICMHLYPTKEWLLPLRFMKQVLL